MELKQRDMLREIYRSNLILHGCKTYNLYITWLVPRDSKVKRILSSDWLPSEKGRVLSTGNFPLDLVPSTLVPKVFLEIFLRERESEQRSGDNESRSGENVFLSLLAASRFALAKTKKISRKTSGTRVRSEVLHLLGNEPKNEVLFPLWSPKKKFSRPYNKSFVNQVCSVKVAGYCSFFFFLVFVHKNTETGLANRELKRPTSTGNDAFSL